MAHGAPDYSNVRKVEFTQRIDDMAELAARTTDLTSLHRGGEVIFCDGFDYGLRKWNSTLLGTGASFTLDNLYTASSCYSARLTGGRDGIHGLYAWTVLPYLEMSSFGYEGRIAIGTDVKEFDFYLTVYNGSERLEAKILISIEDSKVYYRASSGSYVLLASNVVLSQTSNAFNFIKITVDGTNGTYKYLIINSVKYDLSDYELYAIASGTTPYISAAITVYSTTGDNGYINLDNVFVTRNEP